MLNALILAVVDKSSTDGINIPRIDADAARLTDIVNIVYFVAAAVAVLIIILSGLRYVISAGDPKQVTTAKNGILYSVIGLVVISIAFAVVRFIIGVAS